MGSDDQDLPWNYIIHIQDNNKYFLYLIDAQSRLLTGIEQFEKDQNRKISRTSTLSSSEKSVKDPVVVW